MTYLLAAYVIVLGSLAGYALWLHRRLATVRSELAEGTQTRPPKPLDPRT